MNSKDSTKLVEKCPDSPLTRNIRPLSILSLLLFFMFIVLADGNLGTFSIKPGYYSIIETTLATMILAYFGSRGIEKSVRHYRRPYRDNYTYEGD